MDTTWSQTEQKIAETVFRRAYEREITALVEYIRENATKITEIEDLWQLNDLLNAKRHELDGKYDYQYSGLIFVFAQLLKQGWLTLDELKGLTPDKLAKISALARM